jgi:hypothetical protein
MRDRARSVAPQHATLIRQYQKSIDGGRMHEDLVGYRIGADFLKFAALRIKKLLSP